MNKQEKKKLLIIGGGGYIGTKFCEIFASYYEITVFDKFWFGNYLNKNGLNIIKQDAFKINVEFLEKGKFSLVILLSGLSNDPMANFSPYLNYKYNLHLSSYLLDELSKSRYIKKIIFGSSCSVYGNTLKKKFNETDEIKVEYPYGISKYLTDCHLNLISKYNKKIKFFSLRQGTVSGYSPRMRFDLVINKMTRDAMFTKKISVYDMHANRPILDIRDAVNVYHKVLSNKKIQSGIYNLFSYNTNIKVLSSAISNFIKNKLNIDIKITDLKQIEKRSYLVSRKKLDKFINHKYFTVNDTCEDIYANIKDLKKPFDKKYTNLELFKKTLIK